MLAKLISLLVTSPAATVYGKPGPSDIVLPLLLLLLLIRHRDFAARPITHPISFAT